MDRLERVRRKIDKIDKRERKVNPGTIFVLVVVGVVFAGLLFTGVQMTGYATFSEDSIENDPNSFIVEQTRTVIIDAPPGANALLLSGEVRGDGKASVFLITGEKKYLVYYYEGKGGEEFTDSCYGSCLTEEMEDAKLLFELQGTEVVVSNIKYIAPRLLGFEVEPRELVIDYRQTPVTTFDVTVKNLYEKDFDVVLFVDGPLADSFSWQGSMIRFSGEPERTVRMNVVLPDDLAAGEYPHKITVRYVPPEGKMFVGSSPSEEMIVLVKN